MCSAVSSAPSLSIVVVTYNSAPVLPGLLDSLRDGLDGVAEFEVVIVDNDSRDASVDIARKHPIAARVIETGRNAGYAAGINVATATIGADRHLMILNADIRLRPGIARELVDRLTSDPLTGVVVPQILNEDGTIARSLRREPSLETAWAEAVLGGSLSGRIGTGEIVDRSLVYEEGGVITWATGAFLVISPEARRTVGRWDESFFLYSEEIDYMRRVREAGFSVVYVPRAKAVHIGGEYEENPRLYALLTANRIRYFRRHHGRGSSTLFQAAVILGEAVRAAGSAGHRAGLRAAISPSQPVKEWNVQRGRASQSVRYDAMEISK